MKGNKKPKRQQNYWVSSLMTLSHEKIIIDFIYKKVQHIVYLFQHSRYVLDRATAGTSYFQFVYCHLINGIHVYGNLSSNNDLNKFLYYRNELYILSQLYIIFRFTSFRPTQSHNHRKFYLFLSPFIISL